MDQIIFLDIDGVLMPATAWLQPANKPLLDGPRAGRGLKAQFDPTAVALLNRLIERTQGKLVICSNWRKTVGAAETLEKLAAEGIPRAAFHDDFSTPEIRGVEKQDEIQTWLLEHRTTPKPVQPQRPDFGDEPDQALEADYLIAMDCYSRAYYDIGIDYVVIDDDLTFNHRNRHVMPDSWDGFGAKEYRAALRVLGGDDAAMGAYPVMPDDWVQVLAAHDAAEGWGPQCVAAALWLDHEPHINTGWTRARRLNAAAVLKEDRYLRTWGYGAAGGDDERVRSSREIALNQLPKARLPDPPLEDLAGNF